MDDPTPRTADEICTGYLEDVVTLMRRIHLVSKVVVAFGNANILKSFFKFAQ